MIAHGEDLQLASISKMFELDVLNSLGRDDKLAVWFVRFPSATLDRATVLVARSTSGSNFSATAARNQKCSLLDPASQ